MLSRSKPPTISLPFYNQPKSHSRVHALRRNRTRYMAIGLLVFLLLTTLFTFSRATPLLRKTMQRETAMLKMQNAAIFQSNLETITEIYRGSDIPKEDINHLVIVTGHAILLDNENYMKDDAWFLEPYQRGGQVQTFIDHVLKGVEIARQDNRSLLVFSGYCDSTP